MSLDGIILPAYKPTTDVKMTNIMLQIILSKNATVVIIKSGHFRILVNNGTAIIFPKINLSIIYTLVHSF